MKSNFFIKMFTAHSGLSSKRVCGFIGWIVCLFICIWYTIYTIQAPIIADTLFIGSAALLGVDAVMRPFYKHKNQNDKEDSKDS